MSDLLLCDDNEPRSGLVQAMDNSWPYWSPRRACFKMVADGIPKAIRPVPWPRVHGNAGWLINHEQVRILVEDLKGDTGAVLPQRSSGRHVDRNSVPPAHDVAGLCRPPIDLYTPETNQPLKAHAGHLALMGDEIAVQPLGGLTHCYCEVGMHGYVEPLARRLR